MSKVYTIGRDETCDIIIRDNSDVVSRVHATLKCNGKGKYVLVDQSRNGTYVNGIRMSTNVEIPVTRKDIVSFAHVQDLNWEQIPKEKKGKKTFFILIMSFVAITAIAYGVIRYLDCNRKGYDEPSTETLPTDSMEIKVDTIKVRDTIYVKPKVVPEKEGDNKGGTKGKNEKPQHNNEEEVINPLI